MTGQELFHALSFVDERYIAEAETARLRTGMPWMKVVSVAACLCILLVSAFALQEFGNKGVTEGIREDACAAPQAALEEEAPAEPMQEAAPLDPQQETSMENSPSAAGIPAGELQQIPYACLRIVSVLDDGSFETVVEELCEEPTPLEMGMRLMLVIDPAKVPDGEHTDAAYEETLTQDMVIEIRNGAYDAEKNIVYVLGVFAYQ